MSEQGETPEILFLLAPPRSFTTVVSAMLGQHPQLYGLPELQLLVCETMGDWLQRCAEASYGMDHGVVRAVAQVVFGGQTEHKTRLARGWLRRRSHYSTGLLIEEFATRVAPLILVDKSPNVVYDVNSLHRSARMFPRASYIHLVRHPRGYGESVLGYLRYVEKERAQRVPGPLPSSHWLVHLAAYPGPEAGGETSAPPELDPQRAWYALNKNICEFLESVPEERKLRIRAEELLEGVNAWLARIAAWLGVRTDSDAIQKMLHPEESPYAAYGPRGARFGNDRFFLELPRLRPAKMRPHSLTGPLSWRRDGLGFAPEVEQLAREFGYT